MTAATDARFNFVDADADTVIGDRRAEVEKLLADFADALRERPGAWAEWPVERSKLHYRNVAGRIRTHDEHAPKGFQHGFDAAVREGRLYVRHVGEVTE